MMRPEELRAAKTLGKVFSKMSDETVDELIDLYDVKKQEYHFKSDPEKTGRRTPV